MRRRRDVHTVGMAGYGISTEVHGLYSRDGEHKDMIGEVDDLPCDDEGPQRGPEEQGHWGSDGLGETLRVIEPERVE